MQSIDLCQVSGFVPEQSSQPSSFILFKNGVADGIDPAAGGSYENGFASKESACARVVELRFDSGVNTLLTPAMLFLRHSRSTSVKSVDSSRSNCFSLHPSYFNLFKNGVADGTRTRNLLLGREAL